MEKCKQLKESNKLFTQSNQQLSQQMMSIDQRLQPFFQMRQTSDSGSQPPFTHYSQHNEDEDEERKRKRMILTLVIELVAVFPQLVALLLGSSWSSYLHACFPYHWCLFPSLPIGAYFIPFPFDACFSFFCKHEVTFDY